MLSRIQTGMLLSLLLATGCAARDTAVTPLPPAPYADARVIGELADPAILEASGMTASRRRDDLLWVVNDSGGGPVLFAVTTTGETVGRFTVRNIANRDWEDLAAYRLDGEAWLLIADVGDNAGKRPFLSLIVVREPTLPGGNDPVVGDVTVFREIRFRYEDGPRDCEAVAVDTADMRVLLLSKRDEPPRLYALPLNHDGPAGMRTARFMGPVPTLPPPSERDLLADPIFGRFRSQPTAMDMDAAGTQLVVLTYGDAYRYVRRPGDAWVSVLQGPPEILNLPKLKQSEALCIDPGGRTIFVTSEQRPAPLLRLDRIRGNLTRP